MNMVFNVAGQDGISHGVVIKEEQVSIVESQRHILQPL